MVALSRSAPQRAGGGGPAAGVAVDLLDADATERAVGDAAPDVVYHLAARASVAAAWQRPDETIAGNVAMTLNVLEAVRVGAPRARVVVVGSGEAYGPPASLPVGEDAPLRPQNPYAVSKAAADLLAGMYADAHGLDVVRVRAFNHAGPRQSDGYVVGSLTRQVAAGLAADDDPVRVVTGNPEPRRDFTDVRDVVRAYRLLASGAEPGAYNVCSGRSVSVAELVEALRRAVDRELVHEVDPARVRAHEVMEVRGDPSRLRAATEWEPEIELEATLVDAVARWREELG